MNPGSKLIVENNWIETRLPDMSGVGLSIQGAGGSRYTNNVFIGMNQGLFGLKSTGPNNDPHFIWHNTFILSGTSNAAAIWCSANNQLDFANNLFVNSTIPWWDRQFGTSNCWNEAGQLFSGDIDSLGLENPSIGHLWPVAGSVLIDQGANTSPTILTDFFGHFRTTNEPGAFAVK